MKGWFYPYSENKGADQLRGYREADLRLCFRICKNPVFSRRGSFYSWPIISFSATTKFKCSSVFHIRKDICPGVRAELTE